MEGQIIPCNIESLKLCQNIEKGGLKGWWKGESPSGQHFLIRMTLKSDLQSVRDKTSFAADINRIKNFNHQKISIFYQLSEDDFYYYLIIIQPKGISLTEYIKEHGPLPNEKIVSFIDDLIDIFNVMYYEEKEKLEDMLVTTDQIFIDPTNGTLTQIVPLTLSKEKEVSSLFYLPPERIISNKEMKKSSITWVLGIISYFASVGEFPFIGENKEEIQKNIIQNSLVFPSSIELLIKTKISKMLTKNYFLRKEISSFSSCAVPCINSQTSIPHPMKRNSMHCIRRLSEPLHENTGVAPYQLQCFPRSKFASQPPSPSPAITHKSMHVGSFVPIQITPKKDFITF